jgi:gliding motility associated protien GldN
MKNTLLKFSIVLFAVFFAFGQAIAQDPEEDLLRTESSEPEDEDKPIDGIVKKRLVEEREILAYEPIREADIFWEKKVWRVIDIREKMNLPFAYPEMPFFTIIMDAAVNGEIDTYSTEDDKFTYKLEPDEVASMGASVDTVITFDPETYEENIQVVRNDLNPEDVKRYRVKEIWFFDEESSTVQVRILGIAPLKDVTDDNGNFRYEQPMFWVYYPNCRELLARHNVFNPGNDSSNITWEDLMERRYFSSYIMKQSNVYDRRLQDYLTGVDLLLEADKIKNELFNFEQDLWSY